jgi:hypothetical protein
MPKPWPMSCLGKLPTPHIHMHGSHVPKGHVIDWGKARRSWKSGQPHSRYASGSLHSGHASTETMFNTWTGTLKAHIRCLSDHHLRTPSHHHHQGQPLPANCKTWRARVMPAHAYKLSKGGLLAGLSWPSLALVPSCTLSVLHMSPIPREKPSNRVWLAHFALNVWYTKVNKYNNECHINYACKIFFSFWSFSVTG